MGREEPKIEDQPRAESLITDSDHDSLNQDLGGWGRKPQGIVQNILLPH